MNRNMRFAGALSFLVLAVPVVGEEPSRVPIFKSGNDLEFNCELEEGNLSYAFANGTCLGLVTAVSDYQELMRNHFGLAPCIPTEVTAGQLTEVVRKYLREHPERRHEPAVTLVGNAIVAAFCPANK